MILERLKQNHAIAREYGVHGRIKLNLSGKDVYIYTLESPWDYNNDSPNGITGLSCIKEGSYTISIEKSPVNGKRYPFIFNESLGVCLRARVKSTDRTGHCFLPVAADGIDKIYGRFILIGASTKFDSRGFYEPIDGFEALGYLLKYIEESGDNTLKITWIKP